jgi:hypothetical protein
MGEQNNFYSYMAVDIKISPNDAVVVTPGYRLSGGFPLDRLSNTSSDSQPSFSSDHCLSPLPHSPADNMSCPPVFGSNSMPPQQFDSSMGYFQQTEPKHTPSSLGWPPGTDFVKLYKFIVQKGKLPYFQLREKWTPTYETPQKVYLDEPTLVFHFDNTYYTLFTLL